MFISITSPADNKDDFQDLESSKSPNIEPVSNVNNNNRGLKVSTAPAFFKANSTILRGWPSENVDHVNNLFVSADTKSERKFVCPRSYSYESSSNEATRATSLIEPPLRNLDEALNEPPVSNQCESLNASESVDSSIVEHANASLDIFVKEAESTVQRVAEGRLCNKKGLELVKTEDYAIAKQCFKMGACYDNKAACYNLGRCYHAGFGVEQDMDKAAVYYDRAATAPALYNFACLILSEQRKLDERFVEANGIKCLKAAADLGLAVAQNDLAVIYTESGNYKDAFMWFSKAAKQQLPAALYHLGVFFECGLIEDNYPKAAELYRAASRQSHPEAQHNLAVFYENGFGGLPVSEEDALYWYGQAKMNGNCSSVESIDRLQAASGKNSDEQRISQVLHLSEIDIGGAELKFCVQ